MKIIAYVRNDFPEKFGLPRQSGLVPELQARIVFEPEFRVAEALRGIDGFSHLWIIWGFHRAEQAAWRPTVRPPRLGGNTRMGVFATRSPFRPNPIGLSCVRLEAVEEAPGLGLTLRISGCDMMDGTPVYDIKPYLPYADAHPEALGGFAPAPQDRQLTVSLPRELAARLPEEARAALPGILRQDPRPAYQHDPDRRYTFSYAGCQVTFRVADGTVSVLDIQPDLSK